MARLRGHFKKLAFRLEGSWGARPGPGHRGGGSFTLATPLAPLMCYVR